MGIEPLNGLKTTKGIGCYYYSGQIQVTREYVSFTSDHITSHQHGTGMYLIDTLSSMFDMLSLHHATASIQPDNVGMLESEAEVTSIAAHRFYDGTPVHDGSYDLLNNCMPLQDLTHLGMLVA